MCIASKEYTIRKMIQFRKEFVPLLKKTLKTDQFHGKNIIFIPFELSNPTFNLCSKFTNTEFQRLELKKYIVKNRLFGTKHLLPSD